MISHKKKNGKWDEPCVKIWRMCLNTG